MKVRAKNDSDIVIQTAEYDALGRRIKKEVSNAGDFDGTTVYLYDGQKIIETRNGSGTMVQQFIHGTQYIDELVLVRVKEKGDLYVHQDANWNVIALTDLGGKLVERYVYTPYGQVSVFQESGFGDREGDQDVDAADKGTPGTTCSGGAFVGACRVLDLDFDGDYDSADGTLFDSLESGVMVRPGGSATNLDQPFAHQGLLHDAELASYQNRARQYDPGLKRFAQRDPLAILVAADLDGGENLAYRDWNLYHYGESAPTTHVDPSGLKTCSGGNPICDDCTTPSPNAARCHAGTFGRKAIFTCIYQSGICCFTLSTCTSNCTCQSTTVGFLWSCI